ncbi:MAG: hypothetical protein HZY73_01835 [Micropruina sp.]|nr:MAG: hypothetical protein HZY73_01835 [Micropruina sp.]
MSPEPDWALLAGMLAERGRLTPDLTAADAAQALADLIEAGVLDEAGALAPAFRPPGSPPTGSAGSRSCGPAGNSPVR